MMRVAIYVRVLLVTLGTLLAVATSASAECAWLMWLHQVRETADLHSVQSAHTSKVECEKETLNYVSALKSRGYSVVANSREVMGEKGSDMLRYYCLPDTIDPRGTKGK